MNYLEFVKNEETQEFEMIRFRDDALEPFYDKMEEADYAERCELIVSLYCELIDRINEEGGRYGMVQLNGTDYEIHFHMFTSYLVGIFYNSQFWGNMFNVLEIYSRAEQECENCFTTTLSNIFRKITEEPIENFVSEVRLVNPRYTLNGFDERSINI